MDRQIIVALTRDEAEEVTVAAAAALSDPRYLALPDTNPAALTSGINKLASVAPLRRSKRVLAATGRLSVAAVLAALAVLVAPAFMPSPAVASPFANPLYSAATAALGWRCEETGHLLAQCLGADGLVVQIEANENPKGWTFIGTYDRDGKAHRNLLRVFRDPAPVQRLTVVAAANPSAYPHFHAGDCWAMWGTDGPLLAGIAQSVIAYEAQRPR